MHEARRSACSPLYVERNADHAPLQQGEERVGWAAFPFQEEGRFRKNRLTRQQGRPE